MYTVSNTEVTSYNVCKQQHYYNYRRKLEPKLGSLPLHLRRGLVGHAALEAYYLEMKEGGSIESCRSAGLDVIKKELARTVSNNPQDFSTVEMLGTLSQLIEAYSEVYRKEPFKVLEVENVFKNELFHDVDYGMKLDLLVEMTSGLYRGDVVLVDHKFIYNFKSDAELAMDGQLPKYIKTLQKTYTVTKGFFNQIRYRSLTSVAPEDTYRRTWIKPFPVELNQIWEEQRSTAFEIRFNPAEPRRTLSPFICKVCFFQTICKAELMGQDTDNLVAVNYQPLTDRYRDWSGD